MTTTLDEVIDQALQTCVDTSDEAKAKFRRKCHIHYKATLGRKEVFIGRSWRGLLDPHVGYGGYNTVPLKSLIGRLFKIEIWDYDAHLFMLDARHHNYREVRFPFTDSPEKVV